MNEDRMDIESNVQERVIQDIRNEHMIEMRTEEEVKERMQEAPRNEISTMVEERNSGISKQPLSKPSQAESRKFQPATRKKIAENNDQKKNKKRSTLMRIFKKGKGKKKSPS